MAATGTPVEPTAKLDGVNLLPHLKGENTGPPHAALFWRFGPQRAVRSGDWKLTDMGTGAKLFNLAADLGELNDLASSSPEKLKELEAAYATWNADNIEPQWGARPRAGAQAKKKAQAKKAATR